MESIGKIVLLTPGDSKSKSKINTLFPCFANRQAQIISAVERPTPPLIPKNAVRGLDVFRVKGSLN